VKKAGNTMEKIEQLAPWFHNIHLPDGRQTAPNHFLGDFPKYKWDAIKKYVPQDLSGWKVLDIGCNAGFYSIELAKRGAKVFAIDIDMHYLNQAKWVAEQFHLSHNITFDQLQVYDLVRIDEEFDLVWFMGVLYHLRYPMLAMDIVTQKAKKLFVFQTMTMPGKEVYDPPDDIGIHARKEMVKEGWPKMAFIEKMVSSDPTNWWAPNHACVEAMLRSCGMRTIATPDDEIYIAQKDSTLKPAQETWNLSEFLSATGKDWKNEAEIKTENKPDF
jgi:tRNA (mo5U34)-methyltransferase